MHITMVKKMLEGGRACDKCLQAEQLLRNKGLWDKVNEVLWAVEGDANSQGMLIAANKGITLAPFFIVKNENGTERTYDSVLKFVKDCFGPEQGSASTSTNTKDAAPDPMNPHRSEEMTLTESALAEISEQLQNSSPQQIVNWVLGRYGKDCTLSFSGAEDVMLIDLAKKSGHAFSVFTLDTGRLHPETYEFIERVREHYDVSIEVLWPEMVKVQDLVRNKGLFSFYEEGHAECCAIRKVEPLGRALGKYRAWLTGQRRDQSPTRNNVAIAQLDAAHRGPAGPLLKLNPLATLSQQQVWTYLREQGVPYNPLHDRGFVSIGCAPCTRAVRPGEHERAGRWWWEDVTKRECGLHVAPPGANDGAGP